MSLGPMTRKWLIVAIVALVVLVIAALIYTAYAVQGVQPEVGRGDPDQVSANAPPSPSLPRPSRFRLG